MVTLTVVPNEAEAEVVCGMLRANGIACGYEQTNFGAGAADGFPRGGAVEIFVADEDAQPARQLLDEAR
jgi:Putative prokaryotic signal transducing protein